MKEYENISDNCKLKWKENFKITNEKYTQVSGYIFNDKGELLIVKNENVWTIPGGHPEPGESYLETLNREVMEEACVNLKDIKYLGAVEVVENGEVYYQLRYTAKVNELFTFKQEWEISERNFVPLDELHKFITWSNGVTFKSQIDSATKIWGKNNLLR